MMYLHFCKKCNKIHLLNGHKNFCPRCGDWLIELEMSYMDYIALNRTERQLFLELCNNKRCINELGITYRMHRYCKWYRNLQKEPSKNDSSLLCVINEDSQ